MGHTFFAALSVDVLNSSHYLFQNLLHERVDLFRIPLHLDVPQSLTMPYEHHVCLHPLIGNAVGLTQLNSPRVSLSIKMENQDGELETPASHLKAVVRVTRSSCASIRLICLH